MKEDIKSLEMWFIIQFIICPCFKFDITRDNIKLIITFIKQTNKYKKSNTKKLHTWWRLVWLSEILCYKTSNSTLYWLWVACMWRHQNSNFKTMNSVQLHVVYLCFMATPNKFSQESSLISFTCPRDFGKVIGSRNISHVIWRVKLVHYFIVSTF